MADEKKPKERKKRVEPETKDSTLATAAKVIGAAAGKIASPAEESPAKAHSQPKQSLSWAAVEIAGDESSLPRGKAPAARPPALLALPSDLVLVQNVSKLYRLSRRPADRLRDAAACQAAAYGS